MIQERKIGTEEIIELEVRDKGCGIVGGVTDGV